MIDLRGDPIVEQHGNQVLFDAMTVVAITIDEHNVVVEFTGWAFTFPPGHQVHRAHPGTRTAPGIG